MSETVQLATLQVDNRQANAALAETEAALQKTATAAETNSTRISSVRRQWDNLAASVDGTAASLKRAEQAQQKIAAAERLAEREIAKGNLTREQANQVLDRFRQKVEAANQNSASLARTHAAGAADALRHAQALDAAAASAGRAQVSTRLAAHEVTNLSYQLQDAAVQLAGGQSPFLILMQQGPQATGAVGGVGRALSLLMSPVGLAITGVTALAGAGALFLGRAASIEGQMRSLTTTTRAYGTEAGATAEQLRALSRAMQEVGADRGESDAAVKALAGTRGLTGAMQQQIGRLAVDVAAGLETTVADAAKQLATLATEGYPAVEKLQAQIGFLTVDEVKAVRTMAEHGDQAKALAVSLDALHRRFDGLREQSMSPTDRALHQLGLAWNGFVDSVAQSRPVLDMITNVSGAVSRMAAAVHTSPQEQVGSLRKELDDLYAKRDRRDQAKAGGKSYIGIFSVWDLFGAKDGADLDRQVKEAESRLNAATRGVIESTPHRGPVAGTFAGANSFGGKVDEKALEYVDKEEAAYTRLAEAMGGSRAARALNMAAMRAEQEIRDKKLVGDEAERVQDLRRSEAMLELATSYRDEMDNLSLAARGNVALAQAYGVSEAAALRQKAANDAAATAAGNAAVNVGELTRQNIEAAAAAAGADLAKQSADLMRAAQAQEAIGRAAGISGAAQAEAARQADVYRATSGALAAAQALEAQGNAAQAQELRNLAAAYDVASQAKERADAVTPVNEFSSEFLETAEAMEIIEEALS